MYHTYSFGAENMSADTKENISWSQGPMPSYPSKQSYGGSEQYFGQNRAALADVSNAHCGVGSGVLGASYASYSIDDCKAASTSNSNAAAPRDADLGKNKRGAQRRVKRCEWVDIDAANASNPLACSEYAPLIFQHLSTAELIRRPNPYYVDVQPDLTHNMRCVLVDWLVEVSEEYRLCSDTLFLTVNILDRFLSIEMVPREKLQLAGVAAMWLAAKYEEVYAPAAKDFCYITDNTYVPAQMVDMEAELLEVLDWQITVPTVKTFLRRYLQAAAADEQLHYLAAFLAEMSLMSEKMMVHLPSQVAAASVYLAHVMLDRPNPWDATMQHYSGYSESDLLEVTQQLAAVHADLVANGQFTAIVNKYSSDCLLGVGRMAPLQLGGGAPGADVAASAAGPHSSCTPVAAMEQPRQSGVLQPVVSANQHGNMGGASWVQQAACDMDF